MSIIGDRYKILSLEDKGLWNSYLKKLPVKQQDIYYTPEYYSLYENYGDGKSQCFVFEKDGEIALYPYLINSINELGYCLDKEYYDIQGAYGYNGVVSSSYDSEFIDAFYRSFNEYCSSQNIVAEFTRFHPLLQNHEFSKNDMSVVFNRKTIFINLYDYQDIDDLRMRSFSKEARKNIRKAEKQQLSYSLATYQEEYNEFYKLYLSTMKSIGALDYYYFNNNFFKEIQKLKKNHELILVLLKKELVGGFIVLYSEYYAHNYLSAGSILHRKFNINDFMQDIALRLSLSKSKKQIHFGGGNSSDENDPLFIFKSKFSKERANFYIGKKIHNELVYKDVVSQWQEINPDSFMKNSNKILGYREI